MLDIGTGTGSGSGSGSGILVHLPRLYAIEREPVIELVIKAARDNRLRQMVEFLLDRGL